MQQQDPIPSFPSEVAGEVFFTRDDREYRVTRTDSNHVVIHQKGVSDEVFELVVSEGGGPNWYDVVGRNHNVHVNAMSIERVDLERMF